VRHDLYLSLALVLVALALVIPRLLRGDWLGALVALLSLAGLVLAVIGILVASQWLHGQSDGAGWGHRLSMAVGILLRFGLFGFIGAVIASGLAANHHLGVQGENCAGGVVGGLTGFLGTGLYHRLGKARFWPLFGWFALSLLGSFLGGILGILGPEPWSIDAGILIPLVLFLILAVTCRIGTRQREASPDAGSQP
jgi:hypothetical protein